MLFQSQIGIDLGTTYSWCVPPALVQSVPANVPCSFFPVCLCHHAPSSLVTRSHDAPLSSLASRRIRPSLSNYTVSGTCSLPSLFFRVSASLRKHGQRRRTSELRIADHVSWPLRLVRPRVAPGWSHHFLGHAVMQVVSRWAPRCREGRVRRSRWHPSVAFCQSANLPDGSPANHFLTFYSVQRNGRVEILTNVSRTCRSWRRAIARLTLVLARRTKETVSPLPTSDSHRQQASDWLEMPPRTR